MVSLDSHLNFDTTLSALNLTSHSRCPPYYSPILSPLPMPLSVQTRLGYSMINPHSYFHLHNHRGCPKSISRSRWKGSEICDRAWQEQEEGVQWFAWRHAPNTTQLKTINKQNHKFILNFSNYNHLAICRCEMSPTGCGKRNYYLLILFVDRKSVV